MNRIALILALATGAVFALSNIGLASDPSYKLDGDKKRVIAIFDLAERGDCFPAKLYGRVVARTFDARGIVPQSVTIQANDGSRTYINIDTEKLDTTSSVNRSWVVRGLQVLLKEGRKSKIGVFQCGAAGRVMVLNTVR